MVRPFFMVRGHSIAAVLLHYSPPYDRPSTRIWSKLAKKWQSYWMGAILRLAPPEMAPRRRIRRRSVAAALLHHSPSYNLPSSQIWSKLAKKWQSYWMGTNLRMAPPEMAPRRHVQRRSVPATFHHDVPSQDPASYQIGANLVEKLQSYCIFSVFGSGATFGLASGVISLFWSCHTMRNHHTKFQTSTLKNGREKAKWICGTFCKVDLQSHLHIELKSLELHR